MKAKLICYSLGKTDHKTRSRFKRELFGYLDKSNRGGYKYRREGILSGILHIRPIRSVLIIENKDEEKITDFLKKYRAEIKEYDVIIKKNELKNT